MASALDKIEYDKRWHTFWQSGVAPGQKWDIGKSAPGFTEFLDSDFISVQGKAAYVPGCGRGYDIIELAKRGALAIGLDLAPESVEEAKKYLEEQNLTNLSGSAQFVGVALEGDYFTYRTDIPWVDVGYDFTFFCALHPTMRADWARTWGKLVKPGGFLVTLQFPIRPDDKSGPPWPVSPAIYADLLTPLGFKSVYFKEVDQTSLSHSHFAGQEAIACWQKC